MKSLKNVPALLACALSLTLAASSFAQTSSAPKKRSVYVAPPTGSLLGGGYVDANDPEPARQPSTLTNAAAEKPDFRKALAELNAQAGTVVEGQSLIVPAVSLQTTVPVETVKKQHAATGLDYGELLVANSLAVGSGKSFRDIVALKSKGQSWWQLAKYLNINIDSVTAQLRTAGESIRYAQGRRGKRRDQNLNETLGRFNRQNSQPSG